MKIPIELFRGYVPLAEGKIPITKYTKQPLKTLDEVKDSNFAGVMKKGLIMIDIDDLEMAELLYRIIIDSDCGCYIQKTTRGYHFYFQNADISRNKLKVKTTIGIQVEHKVNENTLVPLVVDGVFREWLHIPAEIDVIPLWLRHTYAEEDFFKLQQGSRNEALFKYKGTLFRQGFDGECVIKTINIINKYILENPLPQKEIDTILRDVNETQEKTFFVKKQFQHNVFGDFLLNNEIIVKIDNKLHIQKDNFLYSSHESEFETIMVKRLPLIKHTQRMETLKYLNLVCNKHVELSPENFIALKEKVYDLKTGQFVEYNRKFVFKNRINFMPVEYSELVDATLDKVCCNDKKLRMLLEEMVGYCMFRRNELRQSFILTGEKSSGKSTILKMITKLIGTENICALSLKDLEHNFRASQLEGKLVNIGDDIDDKYIEDDSMFKKLVSGEIVTLERKGKDPFEYKSTIKLIYSANKLPKVNDKGNGFLSRVVVIPFNASFNVKDTNFDPFIYDKLQTDEAIGYLLKLALQGLKRVVDNNAFTKPESVERELLEYAKLNNPVLLFLEDDPKIENESVADVYRKYSVWCIENGYKPLSNIQFGREICKNTGLSSEKTVRIDGKKLRVYSQLKNG